jgi:hypothetical protein
MCKELCKVHLLTKLPHVLACNPYLHFNIPIMHITKQTNKMKKMSIISNYNAYSRYLLVTAYTKHLQFAFIK